MDGSARSAWLVNAFDWSSALGMTGKTARPEEVRKALGQQFEALLVGQMLRAMREAGGGWGCESENAAGLGLMELAEQQLALAMAASGGIGLASLVERAIAAAPAEASGETEPDSTRTAGHGSG